jgi:spoIIIJ-associated protein
VEWIETTGTTVDEAKERALDRLGVAEDELEYEVLAEASRSMLGLRKTEARLRARVRPRQPRPKADRRDRDRNRRGGQDRGGRNRNGRGQKQGGGSGNGRGQKQGGGSGNGRGQKQGGGSGNGNRSSGDSGTDRGSGADQAVEGRQTDVEQSDQAASAGGSSRNRRRGRGRGGSGGSGTRLESPTDNGADDGDTPPANASTKGDQMDLETQSDIVEGFVSGLLDEMGLDARVVSSIEDDRLSVEAQGLNLGLAIGHRGETVRAITEIARTIVQRQSDGDAVGTLIVDVGGYRERRRTFLEEFARNQAEAVLADGRKRALEPMGSADRKVIHDTVADIDGVDTESEGSDRDRRVVIRPVSD